MNLTSDNTDIKYDKEKNIKASVRADWCFLWFKQARRAAVLGLLDAAHALRHVLEHHHEREHQALAHELPESLQAAAWNGVEPGGA